MTETELASQGLDAARKTAASPSFVSIALIGVCIAACIALLPFAAMRGPDVPGMNAFFAGVVFVTELATSFLIFARFRERRAASLLALGGAYAFSALMSVAYLLTFPDALLAKGGLLGAVQSTPWIYLSWINGFALLTLVAVTLEALAPGHEIADERTGRATIIVALGAAAVSLAIFSVAVGWADRLPVLIGNAEWEGLNTLLTATAVAMVAVSVGTVLLVIGKRSELFLWLAVALTAFACANLLSSFAGGRYTLGWFVCRLTWMASACALFLYFMGQFVRQQRMLWRTRDVLEQRVGERTAALSNMIEQRDLLLREVHHRVKNNFQIVNSLVNFESTNSHSDETRTALAKLHRRVYALGLVHQRLMKSTDFETFDVRPFLDDLAASLSTRAEGETGGVTVTAESDDLQGNLDFAGRLGLLVTELVADTLRRFPGEEPGAIRVSLHRRPPNFLALTIAPQGGATAGDATAPDRRILQALLLQLHGELDTEGPGGGVSVVLRDPSAVN